ncbi:MAG: histidine kinase [Oscillospiraceae bacterium]|nr:histidine kinase [Oscillospiraceae bacterium]
MTKRLYKLLHIRTVTGKIAMFTITLGLIIFLTIHLLLPNVVFERLKGYITQPVAMLVKDAARQMGFAHAQHSNILNRVKFDENLLELLSQYYKQPENQREIKRGIVELLSTPSLLLPGAVSIDELRLDSVSVISQRGDVFCREGIEPYLETFMNMDWYKNYQATDGRRIFPPIFTASDGSSVFSCINSRAVETELYDFVFFQESGWFLSSFDLLKEQNIFDIVILGADNEILYAYEEDPKYSTYDIGEITQNYVYVTPYRDGVDFMMLASSQDEGSKLACHVPNSVLLAPFMPLVMFVEFVIGLVMALFIVLSCLSAKISLNKLKVLTHNIRKIQNGDYSARMNIKTSDEFEALGEAFNLMMERVVEHETHEKEMQYNVLISEIDPHFIYNTLNTITYLAKLNRPDDVVIVNRALITMLKDRLKIKGYESFDLLANEIEVINQYMTIQNYLHSDAIKLIWNISDGLTLQKIPKNVLQPLVENAILHGLLTKKDESGEIIPGEIVISAYRENGYIAITIKDSGVGMSAEKIATHFNPPKEMVLSSDNIGIINIIMRLNYLFNDDWSIGAESAAGEGTIVKIVYPAGGSSLTDKSGDY